MINRPEESKPAKGIMGTLPTCNGVLKGRSRSGILILNQIADKFTEINVIKVPRLVISATRPRFSTRTKRDARRKLNAIANVGLPFLETLDSGLGSLPSLAIPKMVLEQTIRSNNTVLAVANKAITDNNRKALPPKDCAAASARGEEDVLNSLQSRRLTADNATRT